MWIWKHGLNISRRNRTAAGIEAKEFLANRFVEQPATHPHADVQAIIDELATTTVRAIEADAGPDTTITIPLPAAGIPVTLDASRSFSVYAPIVEYRWWCSSPFIAITSARPDSTIFLTPGVYVWMLDVKNAWNGYSRIDTMVMNIVRGTTHADADRELPQRHLLHGNYPNPFNPATEIVFDLASAEQVRIVVHDLLGREVALVLDERMGPGRHTAQFRGAGLSSGAYVCRMMAGQYAATRKMVILR